MPRGYIARRRRTKMRSFASNFRGAHLRLNRMITQQVKRAFPKSFLSGINLEPRASKAPFTKINVVVCKPQFITEERTHRAGIGN